MFRCIKKGSRKLRKMKVALNSCFCLSSSLLFSFLQRASSFLLRRNESNIIFFLEEMPHMYRHREKFSILIHETTYIFCGRNKVTHTLAHNNFFVLELKCDHNIKNLKQYNTKMFCCFFSCTIFYIMFHCRHASSSRVSPSARRLYYMALLLSNKRKGKKYL